LSRTHGDGSQREVFGEMSGFESVEKNGERGARVLVTGGSGFIGKRMIDSLLTEGYSVSNVDIKRPLLDPQLPYWISCDIRDQGRMQQIFADIRPEFVIHLAARTDIDGKSVKDYPENTLGTESLLRSIAACNSTRRVIVTSTQYVFKPGGLPSHDEDFDPYFAYGESKVVTEKLTRSMDFGCVWTIVRPTNIWGPWHPHYPHELWRLIGAGLYVHPTGAPIIRSFGYVGNVVYQMTKLLRLPSELVHRRVFYLGDPPIDSLQWVNIFSQALRGRDVATVPRWPLKASAMLGDLFKAAGLRFPIFSTRYKNMVTEYLTPMQPTFETLGQGPYNLAGGVTETIDWLVRQGLPAAKPIQRLASTGHIEGGA
ncbi:MAG: NAD-dependent epimerase/dehydratase family protein, partial [Pyrinomonadaceae bacterium]